MIWTQNLARGDESLENFKRAVDDYVTKNGLDFPAEREPDVEPYIPSPVSRLNLKDAGVSAIVWASGFRCNFDWVKLPIFDEAGEPVHRRGVTQFPGIYFLGLRWLYKRKSAFLLSSLRRRGRGVSGGTNRGSETRTDRTVRFARVKQRGA